MGKKHDSYSSILKVILIQVKHGLLNLLLLFKFSILQGQRKKMERKLFCGQQADGTSHQHLI